MSDAKEREAFEAELAKVDERLREIERIEAELLVNISCRIPNCKR